ncbi:FAD NAD(P)-binding domain-containing [Lecanosticta acicola]|uniref:FAD NAD(P)-binding domain-containing n=1 Tax=Lecanosticta acicola TaxID=111012 RepID=A0AAI9EEE4_9PEZI|nr:FAD NAD(P)-binding domain-containing [Lecanosticta acicola]
MPGPVVANGATHTPDIAIVGGGPAGLSLAAICEKNGISYIVYERGAKDAPPRGGCLDLHPNGGQIALKDAGDEIYKKWRSLARGGEASKHKVFDMQLNHVFDFSDEGDSPEAERYDLQQTLMMGIPDGKIHFHKKLETAERDGEGKIVLKFSDGEIATGFKLVVGADGPFSKIRPLLTPMPVEYWGLVFMTGHIRQSNPFFPTLHAKASEGPMITMAPKTMIWCQRQGTGDYRIEWGILADPEIGKTLPLDDNDAMIEFLLQDKYFGKHHPFIHDMLRNNDGGFRDWPLLQAPPEALNWEPHDDVTLIGDACHATTPFIGEGANRAMKDAAMLARAVRKHGINKTAIAEYEAEMFPAAADMIRWSDKSGRQIFQDDSPKSWVQFNVEARGGGGGGGEDSRPHG